MANKGPSKRKAKATRAVSRFQCLEDLVRFVADGKMPAKAAEELIQAVGMGIGLKERDRAIAEAMNGAPADITQDPVFASGVSAGYEAAIRDVERGVDITQAKRIRGTFELMPDALTPAPEGEAGN